MNPPFRNPVWNLLFAVAGLAAALGAIIGSASTASAQNGSPDCNSTLVDYDSVLGDATPVIIAAGDAEQFGTVRVLFWDETSGSLEDDVLLAETSCSWVGADGTYDADLLVVAVSIETKATVIKYGSEWAPSLDDSIDIIRDRIMNEQFGQGAYVAGLAVGLEQIAARRAEVDGVTRTTTTTSTTSTSSVAPASTLAPDGATATTSPVAPETTAPGNGFLLPDLPTTAAEPPVDSVPDAVEDVVPTTVEPEAGDIQQPDPDPASESSTGAGNAEDGAAENDAVEDESAQGEAQLVPNIDQERSGLGVYLVIAAALAAVFVVAVIEIKRQNKKASQAS